jgi:cation transport ATPase
MCGDGGDRAAANDLAKLLYLLSLSRRAMRAITQNLIISLSVLTIAVGLTIPGILLPVTGRFCNSSPPCRSSPTRRG